MNRYMYYVISNILESLLGIMWTYVLVDINIIWSNESVANFLPTLNIVTVMML